MGVCPGCQLDPTVIHCTVDEKGKHHSFDDLPSVVRKMDLVTGGVSYAYLWHEHGVIHRENGPAKIAVNAQAMLLHWYESGRLHRLDGPAAINEGLDCDWYIQGNKEIRVLTNKRDWQSFDDVVNPKVSQSQYHKNGKGNYISSLRKFTLMNKSFQGEEYEIWEALEHGNQFCFIRFVFE